MKVSSSKNMFDFMSGFLVFLVFFSSVLAGTNAIPHGVKNTETIYPRTAGLASGALDRFVFLPTSKLQLLPIELLAEPGIKSLLTLNSAEAEVCPDFALKDFALTNVKKTRYSAPFRVACGVDFYGGDLSTVPTEEGAAGCAIVCQQTSKCRGAVFWPSPENSRVGNCYLKKTLSDPSPRPGFTAFVRRNDLKPDFALQTDKRFFEGPRYDSISDWYAIETDNGDDNPHFMLFEHVERFVTTAQTDVPGPFTASSSSSRINSVSSSSTESILSSPGPTLVSEAVSAGSSTSAPEAIPSGSHVVPSIVATPHIVSSSVVSSSPVSSSAIVPSASLVYSSTGSTRSMFTEAVSTVPRSSSTVIIFSSPLSVAGVSPPRSSITETTSSLSESRSTVGLSSSSLSDSSIRPTRVAFSEANSSVSRTNSTGVATSPLLAENSVSPTRSTFMEITSSVSEANSTGLVSSSLLAHGTSSPIRITSTQAVSSVQRPNSTAIVLTLPSATALESTSTDVFESSLVTSSESTVLSSSSTKHIASTPAPVPEVLSNDAESTTGPVSHIMMSPEGVPYAKLSNRLCRADSCDELCIPPSGYSDVEAGELVPLHVRDAEACNLWLTKENKQDVVEAIDSASLIDNGLSKTIKTNAPFSTKSAHTLSLKPTTTHAPVAAETKHSKKEPDHAHTQHTSAAGFHKPPCRDPCDYRCNSGSALSPEEKVDRCAKWAIGRIHGPDSTSTSPAPSLTVSDGMSVEHDKLSHSAPFRPFVDEAENVKYDELEVSDHELPVSARRTLTTFAVSTVSQASTTVTRTRTAEPRVTSVESTEETKSRAKPTVTSYFPAPDFSSSQDIHETASGLAAASTTSVLPTQTTHVTSVPAQATQTVPCIQMGESCESMVVVYAPITTVEPSLKEGTSESASASPIDASTSQDDTTLITSPPPTAFPTRTLNVPENVIPSKNPMTVPCSRGPPGVDCEKYASIVLDIKPMPTLSVSSLLSQSTPEKYTASATTPPPESPSASMLTPVLPTRTLNVPANVIPENPVMTVACEKGPPSVDCSQHESIVLEIKEMPTMSLSSGLEEPHVAAEPAEHAVTENSGVGSVPTTTPTVKESLPVDVESPPVSSEGPSSTGESSSTTEHAPSQSLWVYGPPPANLHGPPGPTPALENAATPSPWIYGPPPRPDLPAPFGNGEAAPVPSSNAPESPASEEQQETPSTTTSSSSTDISTLSGISSATVIPISPLPSGTGAITSLASLSATTSTLATSSSKTYSDQNFAKPTSSSQNAASTSFSSPRIALLVSFFAGALALA